MTPASPAGNRPWRPPPSRPRPAGVSWGTPSYMAPEQAAGDVDRVGPATDGYALGAILYECLTGRSPFRAATVEETLALVRAGNPVPVRVLQPGVPKDLDNVV